MASLLDIVASSLDYSLTWCVHGWQRPFKCDWNRDPSLIVVQIPNATCRLEVRDDGIDTEYRGRPGDAFILPAGTVHRFESPECFTSGVNIQYTLFSSVDVLELYRVPVRVDADRAAELAECIGGLVQASGEIQEPGGNRPDQDIDLLAVAREREFAFRLLAQVLDVAEVRPRGRERLMALQKLKGVLSYLEENLERKVSIQTLAEITGLSLHRFGVVFREVIGVSPHQYILRRRIEQAMKLLSGTEYPISSIASQLGFHDQPHFTRLFTATTGVSPTYYRKNLQRRFQRRLRAEG